MDRSATSSDKIKNEALSETVLQENKEGDGDLTQMKGFSNCREAYVEVLLPCEAFQSTNPRTHYL